MNTSHFRTKWLRTSGNFAYLFGVAFLIASLFTSLIPPTVVSAHHANVSGSATCQSNGTYLINWSISNWNDVNGPLTITEINRSIGVGEGTQVDENGVSGSETVSNQAATITLTVSASWTNGNTSTNSGSVKLKGNCYPPPTNTPANTATNTPETPTDTPVNTPTNTPETPANTPTNTPVSDYQLNLSHIACVDGKVEIHFVLLNVPDGITPGTLTYTYGSISPTKNTGNVWHYFDYQSDGFYNVTSASVNVGGTTVNLHNPGTDSGTYDCIPDNTPTNTPSFTLTNTSTNTPTDTSTPTITNTPTSTSTGTITATYTPTITDTPTNTPTDTPTNTPTSTSVDDPYNLEFFCMGFRIISLNSFESSYAWSINGGPSGTGTLPAFGFVDIYTDYYPGLVTLYADQQLMDAGFLPTDCDEDENTPTPPATTPGTPRPTNTPTRRNPTEVVKTSHPGS